MTLCLDILTMSRDIVRMSCHYVMTFSECHGDILTMSPDIPTVPADIFKVPADILPMLADTLAVPADIFSVS